MPFVNMSDLLNHATEKGFGVAAVNVFNYETIRWVVQAAEQERMPVIVQFYPGLSQHIPLEVVLSIARYFAERASIPVAVHLDHSNRFETALSGLRYGYPSIMIDGSSLPYEENVILSRRVVEVAHAMGVVVEGELGHVGLGALLDDFTNADLFTNVNLAESFVKETGVNALAIAVGNAHGHYVAEPHLDFDRIRQIRKAVPVPLVLHGCSDIPKAQLQESVRLGMSKFNIATEYDKAILAALTEFIDTHRGEKKYMLSGLMEAEESVLAFLREKMQTLNPNKFHV